MSDIPETRQTTHREFKLTNLALKNRTTIFLLVIFVFFFGSYSYIKMPKELFPEIVIPTIFVQTIYPGNSPVDIENLITRPLEKELEPIKGIKDISSTSSQDISFILIEFNTNVDIDQALQDVKDAIDKTKSELPTDLDTDPIAMDIDFSEFPILNVNLSGDYSLNEIKNYAELLEDRLEGIYEISKVEIKGLNEREIKINVDPYKMEAVELSFYDIENAIVAENLTISGGEIKSNDIRRNIRIVGEFRDVEEIGNIIVKFEGGNIVYLKDIAEVVDGFADPKDFARLDLQPVVSLEVIKKSGENLLAATDRIYEILDQARENREIPDDLRISITNDQSDMIRMQLSELENSMIFGIILVVFILYLFLGTNNALIVGTAIPLSMVISFILFSLLGYKLNMIILFSLILALGMLVDDAIVVTEVIYRYIERGYSKLESAKLATGEIAVPIITSTLTTVAAFFPLIFWKSIMGEFMKYIPIVLIITLGSSLFVALTITPVFSSRYMKIGDQLPAPRKKRTFIIVGILAGLGLLSFLAGSNVLGNLFLLFGLIGLMNLLFLNRMARWFMDVFLPWLEENYRKTIRWSLSGRHPYWVVTGTIVLFFFTLVLMGVRKPKVEFFSSMDPRYINILVQLPVGTDIHYTNQIMSQVEEDVFKILEPNKNIVKSVLTTVGNGARGENEEFDFSETPHRGRVTVTFVDFEERGGVNTNDILKDFGDNLIGKYPGALVSVEKQSEGPPTGKAINIEVTGPNFDTLLLATERLQKFIENENIPGIEGLKLDLDIGNPELIFHIDRERARRYGLSTGQIAMNIRTALFGKEVSDFKVGEDKYPIQLRLKEQYRYDITALLNQKITFRNQSNGQITQVPISAVSDISYSSTFGAVKRKDLQRAITIYSNVLGGYNANEINSQLKALLGGYSMPAGYFFRFTGEQEEQQESLNFLVWALLLAIALIMVILVTEFNSFIKPLIIMLTVLLSTIGIFGGIATFKMNVVIIMTGIGLIALAGIVVKNGIVLIDYIDLLKRRKKNELGLEEHEDLPLDVIKDCIAEAGKIRLRPVMLTAFTTILGLLPLATGFNFDFVGFFREFHPNIFIGGDNVAFWGPISWAIIFGLTFSTILTLVIVPTIYFMLNRAKISIYRTLNRMK